MPSGMLLLDKPLGLSSNAALQRVRALFGREKAGHVGSLDPLATGMLPICLGEATKVAGDILAGRKCYRFSVALGSAHRRPAMPKAPVTAALPVPPLMRRIVRAVLAALPRARSSRCRRCTPRIKHDGQPLYKLARAGVERAARAAQHRDLRP